MSERTQQLQEFLENMPTDYRGSVTVHYDGEGPVSWEKKECGRFKVKDQPAPRRRVIVRVTDEAKSD